MTPMLARPPATAGQATFEPDDEDAAADEDEPPESDEPAEPFSADPFSTLSFLAPARESVR